MWGNDKPEQKRFNAEQLWVNLKRQGWKQVPPQW